MNQENNNNDVLQRLIEDDIISTLEISELEENDDWVIEIDND